MFVEEIKRKHESNAKQNRQVKPPEAICRERERRPLSRPPTKTPSCKVRSHQRYVEKIKDKHPVPKETQKHKSHELLWDFTSKPKDLLLLFPAKNQIPDGIQWGGLFFI